VDAGPCPGCETLAEVQPMPTEIALGGNRLFWLQAVGLGHVVGRRLDRDGIQIETEHPISTPHDLITDSRGDPFVLSADGRMTRHLTYSTCANAEGIDRLASLGGFEFLMVKSAGLFRGDCGGNTLLVAETISAADGDAPDAWYARANGDVVRCNVAGSTCEATRSVLASGQAGVTTITHDGSRVFWLLSGSGEIRTRAKSQTGTAGTAEVLATGTGPRGIAAAGGFLYWTDFDAGTLVRTEIATKTSTVMARELVQPWGVVADLTHVYVTESGAGRVRRVPR